MSQPKTSSRSEIADLIRARYSLLYVISHEEARVEESLRKLCVEREMRLEVWSITEGFRVLAGGTGQRDVKDPLKALEHVNRAEGRGLFVLRDFHPFLKEPSIVRRLRDLGHELRKTKKSLVLLSPVQKVPPELEKSISAMVYWELPTRPEIEQIARRLVTQAPEATQQEVQSNPAFLEKVVEAALGLTEVEAENVFAKSIVMFKRFEVDVILQEKEQIIRKSGILEFLHPDERMTGVGGLDTLKDWLHKRTLAFSREARDFGLPEPRGILLLGIPGCGKSLTAKSIGALWQTPLLRLDVGRVFGSLVGSSEENIRRAIRTAESVAPCVLWLDELEKGLSGVQSSGQSDAGTSARVFGTFITWLQEKTTPVFVIATANQVKLLPPEVLRKGRFDEIFFVDLPSAEEREEIFRIHVQKKNRNPEDLDLSALVEATEGFSGSEIEQVVISALYDAFYLGQDLTTEGLLESIEETVPLSQTMQEDITEMRNWSRTRARFASRTAKAQVEGSTRKIEL